VNFLDRIWLIPLCPLAGALPMLLVAQKQQGTATPERAVSGVRERKFLVSLFCPGMVLASFLISCGAVVTP